MSILKCEIRREQTDLKSGHREVFEVQLQQSMPRVSAAMTCASSSIGAMPTGMQKAT